MNIHLFISDRTPEGNRLRAALQDTVEGIQIIEYSGLGPMDRAMPSDGNDPPVVVIMVATDEELAMLATWKNFWDRVKTILVLPESESKTVTLGHVLRPRFITFSDSDFSDITAVLQHIRRDSDGNDPGCAHCDDM